MSLRSGAPTFGMPEATMSNYVVGQLARRLGVPLRCGGSLTASKLPDAQAAFESADSLHSTVIGGANYVLHAAGWLESGLVTGYEKLIQDADRLGALHTLMAGLATDDNALALGAYEDVPPGGHFLGSSHTLANYERAYYEATMSDSESFEQCAEARPPEVGAATLPGAAGLACQQSTEEARREASGPALRSGRGSSNLRRPRREAPRDRTEGSHAYRCATRSCRVRGSVESPPARRNNVPGGRTEVVPRPRADHVQ